MRTIIFFDLPVETAVQRRDYRKFVKNIMSMGFYRLQESVFVKLSIDMQGANTTTAKVKTLLPNEGNVIALCVTEKQFASMEFLLGECSADIEISDTRLLEL